MFPPPLTPCEAQCPPLCRVVSSCESWYELMVGKLLYTNPLVTNLDYDLSYCADWSLSEWAADTEHLERGTLDKVLDAALRNDFMEVIALSRYGPFPCPSPSLTVRCVQFRVQGLVVCGTHVQSPPTQGSVDSAKIGVGLEPFMQT